MRFGDNLKLLRKQRKISQEVLAEKVNVSRQSVSKWENGDAYPEMNNILELCKIFHCHINDLVHEDMSDIDSLDKEIKMKVVKFKKEKQRKMKILSKSIYLISRVCQIFIVLGIILSIFGMVITPIVINNTKITDNHIEIFDKNFNYEINDNGITVINDGEELSISIDSDYNNSINIKQYLLNHNNIYHIVTIEFVIACLLATFIIIFMMLKCIEKLFINIHNEDTPFTFENIRYVKKIALYLTLAVLIPDITGLLFTVITNLDMGVELDLAKLFFCLVILVIAYVFEYGYEIQKDSKGKIYGEENE